MSDQPYQRPHLYVGMSLIVAFDKSFTKPMLGIVNMVKTNSASLLLQTDRGGVIYPDCRHKDDPWLLEHPAWLSDRGHAIFDLNEAEAERIVTRDTVQKLVPLLEQQAQKIAQLETSLIAHCNHDRDEVPDDDAPPVRRRPGRPAKTEVSQVV